MTSTTTYTTPTHTRHITQPLFIALLVTALCAVLLTLIDIGIPFLPWMRLVGLLFLVALEAVYTSFWLEHPDRRLLARTNYRLAEFGVLLIITRLFAFAAGGRGLPTLETFRLYLREPLTFFSDGYFLLGALLVFVAWRLAIAHARIFQQLAISAEEAAFYSLPPHEQKRRIEDRPIRTRRADLMAAFFRRWVWGGVVMIVATAVSTIEFTQLNTATNPLALARLGLRPSLVLALLGYFLAGLWLLSQARLQVMNARWLINNVGKEALVEQRWQRSSLFLLLAMALAAAFVPIGSTLPISRLLQIMLGVILYLGNLLWYVILLLLTMLLSWLRPVEPLPAWEDVTPIPAPLPTAVPQFAPVSPPEPNQAAQLLLSSFYWTVLIFLAVSAFLFFLRERGVRVNGRTVRALWQRVREWAEQFWQNTRAQGRALRRAIRKRNGRLALPTPLVAPRRPRLRLGILSPREQVRACYLALVRRAAESGTPRHPHETPLEYLQTLAQSWPEQQADMQEITSAFIAARYTPHEISKARANQTKETWKRLRAVLAAAHRARAKTTTSPPVK